MPQFDYSNHRTSGPKKVPILRIVLLALLVFGIYNFFSDDPPVKKVKKVISQKIKSKKKKVKKTAPKKRKNQPLLLVDSTFSVKTKKRSNGTTVVDFTFIDKKPLIKDSSKLLTSAMISIINRALIHNHHSRKPLALSFYVDQKRLYYFSVKNGKQVEDYALYKKDNKPYWINREGCVFDRPCYKYPGRVELLKFDEMNLVNFKGATGTAIKSIHSGTIHSVNNSFKNGSLIKIHHGNNLYSFYSGIDSTTIKVNQGDHVGTGTIIAKFTEKAPSFFLTMEHNNKPLSFTHEWKKSYPIRSSKTLKEFVSKHF